MDMSQKSTLTSSVKADQLNFFKITALWAFSESAFGGILHALKIPMRGIFISSAAVLFISLIALFSKKREDILKSTLIVILIKAVVTPYSPLTSYFAVFLQGLLGYLFFFTKKFYKTSALILGITVLLFSGLQKIIVLTILFGNTLWDSLNIFIKTFSSEFLNINHPEINYGYLLIAGYVSLHLVVGLFIGLYAGRLPQKIKYYRNILVKNPEQLNDDEISLKTNQKKRRWFLRPTGILIVIISVGVIILSYISPGIEDNVAMSVMVMLLRAFILTFIWYAIAAPIAGKLFQKFVSKRKSEYTKDLEEIILMFPRFKKIVNFCWKNSKDRKGLKRIHYFLSTSFYYLLLSE
jgi:hypothetical protein